MHDVYARYTIFDTIPAVCRKKVRKGKEGDKEVPGSKDVPTDILLAIDYVISMRYFRIFRWGKSSSRLLSYEDSNKLLWAQPGVKGSAMQQFLEGLIEFFKTSVYLPAVHAMLKHPIKAAFTPDGSTLPDEASDHWLCGAYAEAKLLPLWPASFEEESDEWTAFSRGALQVWIGCKLKAEQQSHVAGHHSNNIDRQFTETDRLIKSLLETKVYTSTTGSEASTSTGESLPSVTTIH